MDSRTVTLAFLLGLGAGVGGLEGVAAAQGKYEAPAVNGVTVEYAADGVCRFTAALKVPVKDRDYRDEGASIAGVVPCESTSGILNGAVVQYGAWPFAAADLPFAVADGYPIHAAAVEAGVQPAQVVELVGGKIPVSP